MILKPRGSSRRSAVALTRATGRKRRDQIGVAVVEFALLLPLLLIILFGMFQITTLLNTYIQLVNATAAGARTLAAQRGNAVDPYTRTLAQVNASASRLDTTKLTLGVKLDTGSTLTNTNAAWMGALNSTSTPSRYLPVILTVTYTGANPLVTATVPGLPTLPTTLTATVTERVQ